MYCIFNTKAMKNKIKRLTLTQVKLQKQIKEIINQQMLVTILGNGCSNFPEDIDSGQLDNLFLNPY